MAEFEEEIEYLDEDADIVQQCVQAVENAATGPTEGSLLTPTIQIPTLVERKRPEKRKKIKEDDSDYDPNDSRIPKKYKKKGPTQYVVKAKSNKQIKTFEINRVIRPIYETSKGKTKKSEENKVDLVGRRALNIKIPDYDDPLCLPVKSVRRDDYDTKLIKNWNKLCMDQLKYRSTALKPDSGVTKGSKRTIVLRNVRNKSTGSLDTTIWSKTCVENEKGNKKSEVFQCILPKYREKKMLSFIPTVDFKRLRSKPTTTEIILSKETYNNSEVLVAYNNTTSVSSVYKLEQEDKSPSNGGSNAEADVPPRSCLQESVCSRMCAPCYHMSWRHPTKQQTKSLRCAVCGGTYVSVYNLLTHARQHAAADVRARRRALTRTLAHVVEYHYKCRICQKKFPGIKELREHVTTHQGTETFFCEVGNHLAR